MIQTKTGRWKSPPKIQGLFKEHKKHIPGFAVSVQCVCMANTQSVLGTGLYCAPGAPGLSIKAIALMRDESQACMQRLCRKARYLRVAFFCIYSRRASG